jgi:hypothetical protein
MYVPESGDGKDIHILKWEPVRPDVCCDKITQWPSKVTQKVAQPNFNA